MNSIPIRPFAAVKLATLAALALVLLLLSGCHWVGVKGNGRLTTDTRPVANFTRIVADGAFEVTWTTGAAALSITTDENLLEYLRTSVEGDELRIEWIKPLKGTRGIKIKIASASLTHVQVNGAVRFVGSNLSGPELYVEANGATRMALHGTVNALAAEMNGASRLDAESLNTRAMELEISGAGRADVTVSEALKVTISGAGTVTYGGNPTISKDISGAGSVRRRE